MTLRDLLLWLAHNRSIRRLAEHSALARPLTSRFISGSTLDDALTVARRLAAERTLATLDRLGENVSSEAEAAVARDAYLTALDRIAESGTGATVSGKLTQFGLDVSKEICLRNALAIAGRAREIGSRFEIDMEGSPYTERTLDFVRELHAAHGNVRAVIQAYLYRSQGDIEDMNRQRIPVRICKGAYNEPPSIAFPGKRDVDANFLLLTRLLLNGGTYPAIATHDEAMIDGAVKMVGDVGLPESAFEFQMLYGIRRDLQHRIVAQKYRLRLYVPYGEAWYPYFMRRMAERPANLFFVLRNLFR